jgi:hypothetical protein
MCGQYISICVWYINFYTGSQCIVCNDVGSTTSHIYDIISLCVYVATLYIHIVFQNICIYVYMYMYMYRVQSMYSMYTYILRVTPRRFRRMRRVSSVTCEQTLGICHPFAALIPCSRRASTSSCFLKGNAAERPLDFSHRLIS